jgi:hypothetical protein
MTLDGVKKRDTLELVCKEAQRAIDAWMEVIANIRKMMRPKLRVIPGRP